jgi:hypothetical protein
VALAEGNSARNQGIDRNVCADVVRRWRFGQGIHDSRNESANGVGADSAANKLFATSPQIIGTGFALSTPIMCV